MKSQIFFIYDTNHILIQDAIAKQMLKQGEEQLAIERSIQKIEGDRLNIEKERSMNEKIQIKIAAYKGDTSKPQS